MDLSIVIVNHKTGFMTSECISAVKNIIKSVSYEIIVVDNFSNDDSIEVFESRHNDVKLIGLQKNYGYGTAMNRGVEASCGEYLLLLNSDIILVEDFTEFLIGFYSKHNAGLLGLELHGVKGKFQKTFGVFPSPMLVISNQLSVLRKINHPYFKKYASIKSDNPNTQKVDWITGAFMFLSKKNFLKIGGFDENFFMYYEDVDLCRRAVQLDFVNYFVSEFHAMHNHCGTVNALPKEFFNIHKVNEKKSAIYYLQKYYPAYVKLVVWTLMIIYTNKLSIMFVKYCIFSISKNRRVKNLYKLNSTNKILKTLRMIRLHEIAQPD
ncbi:MAG: glycosyltransferase family 2 protein [Calditrichaceae bacterium]